MEDFLKQARELKKQSDEIRNQLVELYKNNWDKLIGGYFYYPHLHTYIKITGVSKFAFGEEVLRYTYCDKQTDSNGDYEYTTKSGYFYKCGIPFDLVEATEEDFIKNMDMFFNVAGRHLMTYVKGETK